MPRKKPAPAKRILSVIVPEFDERENLRNLHTRLTRALSKCDCHWELIFVDDGSTDGSPAVLRELHAADPRAKAIFLSRNFGQSAAITAGLDAAVGDAVVIMDADGQDPPDLIPAMVEKWKEGYEVVAGRRVSRAGEPLLKRLTAFLYYRVMRALVGWDLPLDTGEFRLLDRKVIEVLKQCPQRQRLIRTLASWPGFHQTTVDYEHGKRYAGKSKYTFRKSLRLAVTSITNFSLVPLRLAFGLGALVSAAALVALLVLLCRFAAGAAPGAMAFAVAGLWLLGGLQCLLLGILGEYVGRTHIEAQQRPIYVVRERIGWK